MGKRVALIILVLLIIGAAILYLRSTRTGSLPGPVATPLPAATAIPTATTAATPGAKCNCTEPPAEIPVNAAMTNLPDTCVHVGTGTMLQWRATDNSRLQIKIPDWGTEPPTTGINPYPAAQCPANPGTYCASGAFAGSAIPDCTSIRYSVTTSGGAQNHTLYGHIIIVRP